MATPLTDLAMVAALAYIAHDYEYVSPFHEQQMYTTFLQIAGPWFETALVTETSVIAEDENLETYMENERRRTQPL